MQNPMVPALTHQSSIHPSTQECFSDSKRELIWPRLRKSHLVQHSGYRWTWQCLNNWQLALRAVSETLFSGGYCTILVFGLHPDYFQVNVQHTSQAKSHNTKGMWYNFKSSLFSQCCHWTHALESCWPNNRLKLCEEKNRKQECWLDTKAYW